MNSLPNGPFIKTCRNGDAVTKIRGEWILPCSTVPHGDPSLGESGRWGRELQLLHVSRFAIFEKRRTVMVRGPSSRQTLPAFPSKSDHAPLARHRLPTARCEVQRLPKPQDRTGDVLGFHHTAVQPRPSWRNAVVNIGGVEERCRWMDIDRFVIV